MPVFLRMSTVGLGNSIICIDFCLGLIYNLFIQFNTLIQRRINQIIWRRGKDALETGWFIQFVSGALFFSRQPNGAIEPVDRPGIYPVRGPAFNAYELILNER